MDDASSLSRRLHAMTGMSVGKMVVTFVDQSMGVQVLRRADVIALSLLRKHVIVVYDL